MRIKNHFHINGFALSLTLKQRLEVRRSFLRPSAEDLSASGESSSLQPRVGNGLLAKVT